MIFLQIIVIWNRLVPSQTILYPGKDKVSQDDKMRPCPSLWCLLDIVQSVRTVLPPLSRGFKFQNYRILLILSHFWRQKPTLDVSLPRPDPDDILFCPAWGWGCLLWLLRHIPRSGSQGCPLGLICTNATFIPHQKLILVTRRQLCLIGEGCHPLFLSNLHCAGSLVDGLKIPGTVVAGLGAVFGLWCHSSL